jgi:CDP-diacylglycerol---glycerol-3-phosphate 3-phosphatidyltransferase
MGIVKFRKDISVRLTRPIVSLLAHTGITPNAISLAGFVVTVGAAVLIATGHLFIGGWIMLAAAVFDMFDGALARYINKSTKFGSALDSTLDRVSEAVILVGLMAWYVESGSPWLSILAAAALVFSYLVSYIRARAEGLGLELRDGFFTRAERVIVLALGLLLSRWPPVLIAALAVILVLSLITACQRLYLVYQKTK